MIAARRHLRWIAPLLVLGIAAVLRFWALGRPDTLVFDELYYVRDAISQLTHGYPTVWPDSNADLASGALDFGTAASNAVHPPLGKWLIGLGVLLFGPDNGWGWRSAVAFFGVATVGVTMRLGWLLSRSRVIACTAGLLLAVDGVHVVLTRVGLLDGFLTFAVALGALFVWQDHLGFPLASRRRVYWRRPWLLAAGVTFGAATAIKWSGLYALAFFLVFITVQDLLVRRRIGVRRPWFAAGTQAGATAVIALPSAALVYLASWAGWIVHPGGWAREPGVPWFESLVRYHAEMLNWHGSLTAEHPFQAHPLTWPLALRPTAMYELSWDAAEGCPWAGGCIAGISPIPNPVVTWGGVAALVWLVWLVARACFKGGHPGVRWPLRSPMVAAGAFVLVGYLSGWLPWVLTFSRSAVFQFYAVILTPFSALALALVLGMLCGIAIRAKTVSADGLSLDPDPGAAQGRRIGVALFLVVAVLLAILFFPVWSGLPVADWFWQAHMWLPGWS